MQKFKSLWWYGVMGVLTGIAVFCVTGFHVSASQSSSEEVYFTHVHTADCNKQATYSCESQHTCWRGYEEYKTLRCSSCNASASQKVVCDSWQCPVTGLYWQMNVVMTCSACGYVNPAWPNYNPAAHVRTGNVIGCGMEEGEATLGISIMADTTPTNTDVTLTVSERIIKEDGINNSVSYDWGGKSLTVTENGMYSITATNSGGQSVTASVTITCIDKGAPVIKSVVHDASTVTQNSVTVSVSATDSESGLAESAYSIDGGATWSAQNTFTVSEGGDVLLVVRDRAGNTTSLLLKRNMYPYPPKPSPAPTPVPTPVPTPAPAQLPDTKPEQDPVQSPVLTPEPVPTSVPSAPPVSASASAKETVKSGETEGTMVTNADKNTQDKDEEKERISGGVDGDLFTNDKTPGDAVAFTNEEDLGEMNLSTGVERPVGDSYLNGKNPLSANGNETGQGVLLHISDEGTKEQEGVGGSGYVRNGQDDTAGMRGDGFGGIDSKEGSLHNAYSDKIFPLVGAAMAGGAFILVAVCIVRFFWINSAVLYCYDGGDEYKKLGIFFLHKNEDAVELYLPEYLTETTDILRYRLLLKKGLVKKFAGSDLTVYNEDSELRRPLEECVDFVL